MHVIVQDARVPVRPTWRAFVLSMATGSLYQLYWLVMAGRELGWLGVRTRTVPLLTMAIVAASQVAVLGVSAVEGSSTFGWLVVGAALAAGSWSMWELGDSVREIGRRVRVTKTADPRIAALLFVVGCAVGATGVLPQGDLGAWERVAEAFSTGIVLPFWLLYLQFHMNAALKLMNPVSDDEELFGAASNGDAAVQELMRRRIAVWRRRQARETEQELVPWATYGLGALCTAVFAWQVLSFGLDLSLREMRASGALTMDLVRDGEVWRLLTQHVVHFSVDHWAFNMFALAMTGWIVERTIGHRKTVAVMAGAVVGATAASWFLGPLLYGSFVDKVVSGGESGIGFGMIGALLAIDRHGHTETGRFGRWLTIIGLVNSLAPGVGILAHAGGFIGGYLAVYMLHRVSWELPEIDASDDTFEVPSATEALSVAGMPAAGVAAPTLPAIVAPPSTPPVVVAPPSLPPIDRRFG
jgi:membrane associated rhomboid family serine protease